MRIVQIVSFLLFLYKRRLPGSDRNACLKMATIEETIDFLEDNGGNMTKEVKKFVLKVIFYNIKFEVQSAE